MDCAETGDGHFLRAHWNDACKVHLTVDAFDNNADVKMDLNLAPNQAPQEVKAAFGSMDIVVSHQVFEHLKAPTSGIVNLNSLLKQGGFLVFTTPFIVPDHRCPTDYFRYTTQAVEELLTCAGFQVSEVKGLGSLLENLAYVAGIPASQFGAADLNLECSGVDCRNKQYSEVAALGKKISAVSLDDVKRCWG